MSTLLKAYIVVLFFSFLVFFIAKNTASSLDDPADFKRRRNLWFAILSAAFLVHNFWLYVVAVSLLLYLTSRKENHKETLFLLLVLAVPPVAEKIPAFGIINYLFEINHARLLSIVLLVPAYFAIRHKEKIEKKQRGSNRLLAPDIIILLFIVLNWSLELRDTTITNGLRYALYAFTDGYVPYYVISRSLQTKEDFRRVFMYFVIAVGVMCVTAVFEHLFHWVLYQSVINALGLQTKLFDYLMRAGGLRAMASTGHAIALGYVIVIAIGFMLHLRTQIKSKILIYIIFMALFAGLYATLSRGPWVGMAVLFGFYTLTGPKLIKSSLKWLMLFVLTIPILTASPWGQKFIDLLPIVGSVETKNIDYREQLIDNAIIVIEHHPWFGLENFLDQPEMQKMMQGGGIIDIVNTYIGIALKRGLLTLSLFVGFFGTIIFGIIKAYRSVTDEDQELKNIGRVLSSVIVSILFIIATVSPISIIALIYWIVAGMGVAYIRIVRMSKITKTRELEQNLNRFVMNNNI